MNSYKYFLVRAVACMPLITLLCFPLGHLGASVEGSVTIDKIGQSSDAVAEFSPEELRRTDWMKDVEPLALLPYFHKKGYLLVSEYRGRSQEWDALGRYVALPALGRIQIGTKDKPIDIDGLPQKAYVTEGSVDFVFEVLDYADLPEADWSAQLHTYLCHTDDTQSRMAAALQEKLVAASGDAEKCFRAGKGFIPYVRRGYDAFILGRFDPQKTETGYKILARASFSIVVDVVEIVKTGS